MPPTVGVAQLSHRQRAGQPNVLMIRRFRIRMIRFMTLRAWSGWTCLLHSVGAVGASNTARIDRVEVRHGG
jgi:hypothetical protein